MSVVAWSLVILILLSVTSGIVTLPHLYRRWRQNYIANEAQQFLKDIKRKHL